MQSYEAVPYAYRSPRTSRTFAVELVLSGTSLLGIARDISASGLKLDLDSPVLVGSCGRVRFRVGRCLLELEAHVVHTEGFTAGVSFDFASKDEEALVLSFVQHLANQST